MTRLTAATLATLLLFSTVSAENARFSGRTRNGDRVSNGELAEWHDEKSQPKLDGRSLFDANNPFRWILDESSPPPPSPKAYVEFVGGDRLPGRVVGGGSDTPFDRRLDHVLVEPTVPLDDPNSGRTTQVRVATRSMRRIVWDAKAPRRLQPGTLFHLDGRETAFRTLRWSEAAVLLLTPGGLETVSVRDVSEIHFPEQDEWEAYFDELATLDPDGDATLVRWETRDGLVVTSSSNRFTPTSRGDRRRHENWHHLVQPVWSLDPFWIRFGGVRSVRFWKANEVPLSRVRPAEIRRESVFGSSWNWRADSSAQGTTLRAGGHPHGWGFGVHARTELHFDLPAFAESFESDFGLDALAGSGGCVRAAVHLGSDLGRRLHESPLVVGSVTVHSTGTVRLPDAKEGTTRLVLVADMARGAEPAGGDPFDVRDVCDWLDPVVRLKSEELANAVRRRSRDALPGLAGWTAADVAPVRLRSRWDRSDPRDPRYVVLATVEGPFESWSRTLRPGPEDRWLAIAVNRYGDDNDPRAMLQVRVDGATVGEVEVPSWRDEWGPNPILVPVDPEWRERELEVELVLLPAKPGESFVRWRGVEFVEHPPHLIRVFDEQLDFPRSLRDGDGTATVTLEDSSRGASALVVTPAWRGRAELDGLSADVRERPRIGEFRYLRFAWRKNGGKQIGLQVAHDGEFGVQREDVRPRVVRERTGGFQARRFQNRDRRGLEVGYRYDASAAPPKDRRALRLDKKPPEDWRVVTRDLYADFGEFELTGFAFEALDGEAAYFDEVYLARKGADFVEIDRPAKPPTPPEFARWEVDPWRFHDVLSGVAPGFASREIGGGAILLHEYRGRRNVLRTFGPEHQRPCVLRTARVLPKSKRVRLVAEVARDDSEEWKLEVLVNGDRRFSEVVGRQSKKDEAGWSRFEIDLTEFAGQPVDLTVRQQRHNDRRAQAYWSKLRIESE